MKKEEILIKISQLLPKIQQWTQSKEVSLEDNECDLILEIGSAIIPGKELSFYNLPSAGELLTLMNNYYQAEINTNTSNNHQAIC